ncbi:alpha/beta hydrolase [soil metagenome]
MVADRLRDAGHAAYRPTLTGLGERQHLGQRNTNLDTHIDDVVNLLKYEDLSGVMLVGQSYGGAVVTGVADRVPDRIGRLVYVDAFVPRHGESVNDLSGSFAGFVRERAEEEGHGWQVPVWFSAEDQLLPANLASWYMSHVGAHPLATLDQPIELTGAAAKVPISYIDCEPPGTETWVFRPFAELARTSGWDYRRLPVGHDAHVIDPDGLVVSLIAAAAAG